MHSYSFADAPTSRASFVVITRTCGGVLHKERIKRQAIALSKVQSYTPGASYAGAHEARKGDDTWICQIARLRNVTHYFCGAENHEPTVYTDAQRPLWLVHAAARSPARALGRNRARVSAARSIALARLTVLAEEAVKCLLLADRELSGLNARVVHTQQRVDVIHRLRADVRELLDLRGCILDLCEVYVNQQLPLTSGAGSGRRDVPRRR